MSCTVPQAKAAEAQFLDSLPKLKRLKTTIIPRDAARGYFIGLDGRKVKCDSAHHMLAGYLQNGESVVMKTANIIWKKRLIDLGVWNNKVRQVNFVHDEWQTEVRGSKKEAEYVGKIQREAIEEAGRLLGVKCPLAGSTDIGKNWSETH